MPGRTSYQKYQPPPGGGWYFYTPPTTRFNVPSRPLLLHNETVRKEETLPGYALERVTAMAEKRVMVLKNDTLFMAAVLSLLSEQPTLEVLGIATGDEGLHAKMCGFSPDVVVLAAEAPDIGRNSSLSTILQGYPEVPVVALNESTSEIRTYLGQRVISSATAADLLSIIAETVPVN